MSQILTIPLDLNLETLHTALKERGIEVQQNPGRKLLLPVSSECIAEPVDLLCKAGAADTLEAWGFRTQGDQVELVCGQFDRNILQEGLLDPIRRALALQRVTQALQDVEPEIESDVELQTCERLLIHAKES